MIYLLYYLGSAHIYRLQISSFSAKHYAIFGVSFGAGFVGGAGFSGSG